jgi:hypothetical protein
MKELNIGLYIESNIRIISYIEGASMDAVQRKKYLRHYFSDDDIFTN